MERYRVLKINGLTKKVLLEVNSKTKLFKKYDISLFDENVHEHCFVEKYNNVDDESEFIFITCAEQE